MKKIGMLLGCLALVLAGCGDQAAEQYYEKGMEALEKGQYQEAVEDFQQVVDRKERLSESYRGMGLAWMEQESYPEAIAAFSRSLNYMDAADETFSRDVRFYLAEARMKSGDDQKAIEIYSEILQSGWNDQALFLRGKAYADQGDYKKAGKDFDKALKDCKDYDLYINIYRIYMSHGREAEGGAYLQQALAMEPKTGEDYYHRARIYEYQKDYQSAVRELITSMKAEYEDAMLLLGKVYLESDDPASARSMYQEYLAESEKDARAYNGLAMCDIYEEKYDSAMENIQKGLNQKDQEEMQGLLYNEIVILEYQQDYAAAREKMKAYLEQYPEDADAIRENAFLSTR